MNRALPKSRLGQSLKDLDARLGRLDQEVLRRLYGEVSTVDPGGRNLVQVRQADGSLVAGGRWLRLKNSPLEIAHRFGALRVGLKVEVLVSGQGHISPVAELIASEREEATTLLFPNDIGKDGLYKAFL